MLDVWRRFFRDWEPPEGAPTAHRGGVWWVGDGEAWRMRDAPVLARHYRHDTYVLNYPPDEVPVPGKRAGWCVFSPSGIELCDVSEDEAFAAGADVALTWAVEASSEATDALGAALETRRAIARMA